AGFTNFPQVIDDAHQRGVSSALGNCNMELPIRALPLDLQAILLLHPIDDPVEPLQLLIVDERGSKCRGLALDDLPRFHALEGPNGGLCSTTTCSFRRGGLKDENTRTHAHFDQALQLEGDHSLAHGWPTDVEHLAELSLGWKAAAGQIPARENGGAQLVGH